MDHGVAVGWHDGPREELRALFALAEDSPRRLAAALPAGRVLTAREGDRLVGCLQLVGDEVTILAVAEDRQGRGLGRALVERAAAEARSAGRPRLVVATGAADV